MTLIWEQTVVDARDPSALGQWWREALGWVVINDDSGEFEIRPAEDRLPGLLFVPVPEAKTTKNRLHLDFRPDDRTLRYSDYLPWAPREQTWDRASGRGWSSQTPKATSSAYLGHAPPSRR